MTRYQIVKIVEWAGTLHSRKRLQKVVFLLQTAGCPFEVEYSLHHYGPYSQEVAQLSDEVVKADLLKEAHQQHLVGLQYSYELTIQAKAKIKEHEATSEGKLMAEQMTPFETKAKTLLGSDLRELEVASTLVYFRSQGHDWQDAIEKTCKFKKIDAASQQAFLNKVGELARQFIH